MIGAPSRMTEIFVIGALGMLTRNQSYAVRCTILMSSILYSVLSFLSGLFNLPVWSLIGSVRYLTEMEPCGSAFYLIAGGLAAANLAVAIKALHYDARLKDDLSMLLALGGVVALTGVDQAIAFNNRGAYARAMAGEQVFDSGVRRSGFATKPSQGRHLMLVMVESMGLPLDRGFRDQLFARWRAKDVRHRYQVMMGTSPFAGSTTNAEMRALCDRWAGYEEVIDMTDRGCLPARLRAMGYTTSAYHSFDGGLFDRNRWYGHIGFDTTHFRDELYASGASACGGIFPGACDRDVPAIMARQLKTATKPQFLYWLTLNTHLPVPAEAALHTISCREGVPPVVQASVMICRQFMLWTELQQALADQLVAADFPDTDILIVGDHMPPYFLRAERQQFDDQQVPWILLRARHVRDQRTTGTGRVTVTRD
ncbi:MAG: hypothetical protein B7Y47_08700 [Sphingomonas sp. 28-63-12]|nr:MAG: hypothetical protein B7Y47_08700 [Sphingomonas sp. 28-63-12]